MEKKKAKRLREILSIIPKTEIHLHLEALASIDTIWNLIKKHNLSFPGISTKQELEQKYEIRSLDEFITLFINIIQTCFQHVDDLDYLFEDAASYLKRNNIVYAEIFFAPSSFLNNGLSFERMMDKLDNGAKTIKKRDGIDIRFIIDVSRTFGIENAIKNLDLTIQFKPDSVIGIGLGGSERKGPAKDFKAIFAKAKQSDLHVVAHAGEDVGPESIWDAVKELKAERIGHGISAIQDISLMDYLRSEKIPLEICPTSNLFTRRYVKTIQDHPIKDFYNHGMVVTVNTDDPAIFSVDLVDEYMLLYENGIFTEEEILHLVRLGIYSTFLPDKKKEEIWSSVTPHISSILAE